MKTFDEEMAERLTVFEFCNKINEEFIDIVTIRYNTIEELKNGAKDMEDRAETALKIVKRIKEFVGSGEIDKVTRETS
jgi:uncharacterized protein Yka (UPF0111/DUF47 family)